MAFKEYDFELTETAESDIDDENETIVILRFVYSGRNQDKIVKEF
jgi:hypothetical protein